MKVRVTVRFRGREITYPELALEDLREIAEELSDVATLNRPPTWKAADVHDADPKKEKGGGQPAQPAKPLRQQNRHLTL